MSSTAHMREQVLQIDSNHTEEAWELLGHHVSNYGDNGGEPDGNAWLPRYDSVEDVPTDVVEQIVREGYGWVVTVAYVDDDDEMLSILGLPPRPDVYEEWDEDLIDRMKETADQKLTYAHFGAYGALDSQWVYVVKEQA